MPDPARPTLSPPFSPAPPFDRPTFDRLASVLHERRVAVLSGAGISTESGIPDYRGPETRRRARNPIQFNAFVGDAAARQRYWARATVGYRRVAQAQPNAAHRAVARLEDAGVLTGLITQNVDRLHQAAGSHAVVELHGALADVRCLQCGVLEPRAALQQRLEALNPGWQHRTAESAPDGDAELAADATRSFQVPTCLRCEGPLKPDVVFFGETVPRPRVAAAYALLDAAEALLVVGSSLAVYSGYRFVLHAAKRGTPVAIINLGPTRGDERATVCLHARLGEALPALVNRLLG